MRRQAEEAQRASEANQRLSAAALNAVSQGVLITGVDLLRALREKEALLREVHHRVKNNLQVISSLLRLESGRSVQAETQPVVDAMVARVRAMAMLHDALYRTDNFAAVDLAGYLRGLAVQAFNVQLARPGAIALQVDLAPLSVTLEQAMPCGLLVTE